MPQHVKSCSARESQVHHLVQTHLPGTSPTIISTVELGDGKIELRMVDERGHGFVRLEDRLRDDAAAGLAACDRAVGALTGVHETFRSGSEAFRELGALPHSALEQFHVGNCSKIIDGLVAQAHSVELYDFLRRVAAALHAGAPPRWDRQRPTLLHGDFHFRNVLADRCGCIRILDWGEAAVGPAVLDLALLPPRLLQAYRRVSTAQYDQESEFLSAVRWASLLKYCSVLAYCMSPRCVPVVATPVINAASRALQQTWTMDDAVETRAAAVTP